ncbi:polysaccharide deacetylase family protein [Dyella psychrodurans]|nr:polysaccharide deacetylase family protein [Dyella psychrodurans]
MALLRTNTSETHIFHRHMLSVALLLLWIVCLVLTVERNTQAPLFVLHENSSRVTRLAQHDWRRASDWLAGRKYAVLTFDDGPYGQGVDEQILDVLRKHHAHAIFFVICNHLDKADPGLLSEFERSGHVIGNHSYDHLKLTKLSAPELHQQIEGCSERIAMATGHRPAYFRPPWGITSAVVKQAAESSGMQQVLWNANSQDSWQNKPEQILHWSLEQTEDESILLMHSKPTTVAVLDETLTKLEERGFEFVLPGQLSAERSYD